MCMSPGTYLTKRRKAAGMQLDDVVCALACSARRQRPVTGADLPHIHERLAAAENDAYPLHPNQALLLLDVFRFDPGAYERLLLIHVGWDVPEPRLCSSCACSWNDACHTTLGPCAWSENNPDLCTACAHEADLAAAFADWPDAHFPKENMHEQKCFR